MTQLRKDRIAQPGRWTFRWASLLTCAGLAAWAWMAGYQSSRGQEPQAPAAQQSNDQQSDDPQSDDQQSDDQPSIPPAQTEYLGRTIAPTMHYFGASWLTRESRQREEDCRTMLANLGIKPGMTVCDMGCGNGFYSLQLARRVGAEGVVLAVDIQPEMLRLMQARAAEAQIDNIRSILGTFVDPKLPEGEVDLILCVDVYHEFSHPEQMLTAMRKALKPDGRVVLLEFRAEDPEVPIRPLHKMTKQQVTRELTANGFELAEQFDGLPWQHMMFFKRAD